jgi:molybdopterin converting factor small subunit
MGFMISCLKSRWKVRGAVLILVHDEVVRFQDIRLLRELQTSVRSGDSVRLIPDFAGG